ncbi:MAG: hypothetical protein JSW58_00165 [Candidatus Latescibacterota bacterium]|nr:MAG: hypothetical protein JSW58_00165 [Candidatus Latescibacterota bacterium]
MTHRVMTAIVLLVLSACGQNQESTQGQTPEPTAFTGKLTWTAPEGWIDEKPASSIRLAQYRLPRVEGDPEDASAVVFHFPGAGGSVEANLERWYRQFIQSDGKPSAAAAKLRRDEHHGLKQTTVDLSGTFRQTTTPMGPESEDKPNFRMLAGVVETSAGPWFVKVIGPERTVAHWEQTFYEFMKSFKPESQP